MVIEYVIDVYYWNDMFFSFCIMCDLGFCFESGYFVMIGLEVDGCLLMCVYFIVSVNWEEYLEFFLIKVLNGLFILCLQYLKFGDLVIVSCKFIGMLVFNDFKFGKYFYLLGIGMGLVLFFSIICDLEIYECFDKIVLVYGVCYVSDFVYVDYLQYELLQYEYLGELVCEKFIYYFSVICDMFCNQGCIIDVIVDGQMSEMLGLLLFNFEIDCVMFCGSLVMLDDLCVLFDGCGFQVLLCMCELGDYVIEWVFVEKQCFVVIVCS